MNRPFPGMDPFLERPDLWPGIHLDLLYGIAEDLQPQLVPRYIAVKEQHVVLAPLDEIRRADVHVRPVRPTGDGVATAVRPAGAGAAVPEIIEVSGMRRPHRYVAIRDAGSREVVTVIEVFSPWNKRDPGRTDYLEKQKQYLLSRVNLVEIDLLRGERSSVAVPEAFLPPSDYRVCIHRARWGDVEPGAERFELIRFRVRDELPDVAIPLRDEDPDVILHLGRVFARNHAAGAYAFLADYSAPCDPPLPEEDAAWAAERLAGRG